MMKVQTQIYQIEKNFNALNEEDYERKHPEDVWDDLWTDRLVYDLKFREENDMDISDVLDEIELPKGLPNKIVMFGWFDLLEKTELPSNSLSWTIISKNFLEVIKQLGFTDYRLIPIRVIDRTPFDNVYSAPIRSYENDTEVQNLPYNDNLFYGFQVLTRLKILNDESNLFRSERKIIWRDDLDQLDIPLFFRSPLGSSRLLVNQKARDALEAAGIRGIRFIEPFGI
jgi:hypothetical protein